MLVLFPDFYSPRRAQIADTQYKFGVNGIQLEDLFPLLVYAHVLKAKHIGIIFLDLTQMTQFNLGELNGFGRVGTRKILKVSQAPQLYGQFIGAMKVEEAQLKKAMVGR